MTDTIPTIGADGKFAGLVVPALASRGARVRGLIRDPSKADAVRASGASEVGVGDLRDPTSVARALEGVASVFYIAPAFLRVRASMPAEMLAAQVEARAIQPEETGEDLVGTVFFLASPDADFMSGQTLNVDGGKHML